MPPLQRVGNMVIDALILAGGEGRRMGGQDKGLVEYQGHPLVEHLLQRLHQQSLKPTQIAISANRYIETYQTWGYPVLRDSRVERWGPLAGLEAGLAWTQADWLLTVPCDTPHLPLDLLARLYQTSQTGAEVSAVYACSSGQVHPSIALYRMSVRGALQDYLARGRRSVLGFLNQLNAVALQFETSANFVNMNTPGELNG